MFTGNLMYKDILFAYYPSTDPKAYLTSLEKIEALPVKKVFPSHHSLDIQPKILNRVLLLGNVLCSFSWAITGSIAIASMLEGR